MIDRFDWSTAYHRMEQARRKVDAGASLPPDEVQRLLQDRAEALAQPLPKAQMPVDQVSLLIFSLAGEQIAIEMDYVIEVIPLQGLTPVPGTPPLLLGVVNHRGRLLPVLDLRILIGLVGKEGKGAGQVVAVLAGGMTFGIFVEATRGARAVAAEDVLPPPLTASGDRRAFVRGVTRDLVAVLDLAVLARDPRITVNEEVE